MKSFKISKRDIKFFLLGIFTFFIIETVWNWDESVEALKNGFNSYNEGSGAYENR